MVRNYNCSVCCGKKVVETETKEKVTVDGHDIERVKEYIYLGDAIEESGSVADAVELRIKAAWNKFKELSGMLCRKGLSFRRKGILYKSCVRSVLLYGAQSWPLRESEKNMLVVCQNRMLRMMSGVTLMDKVRSEKLRSKLQVECLDRVIEVQRLRWLGHILRRPIGTMTRDVLELKGDKYDRGRPKLRWEEIVYRDMKRKNLAKSDANDRNKWRRVINVPFD